MGVGTVTLFILSITHVSNLQKHSIAGFFPSLQCHYKTMFFVCGICSNFTALALFCTDCSALSFLIRVLTMGYGDSFILFYLRMLLLAPAQATVNPRVFFPSDRTTHTSSIIWPLSAWQVTSAFPPGCIMFVCVLCSRDSNCNINLRQSSWYRCEMLLRSNGAFKHLNRAHSGLLSNPAKTVFICYICFNI